MTKIYCENPKSKNAWKRMLKISNDVWENLDKPDGKLIAHKGWNFEIPIDTVKRYLNLKQIQYLVEENIIWIV